MKLKLTALALLFAFTAGAASAGTMAERMAVTAVSSSILAEVTSTSQREHNLPFLRGNTSPQDLAKKMRAVYKRTSDYNAVIDPERCKTDGSCASIRNYWESFRVKAPGLTLEGTIAYVEHFQRRVPTAAERATEWSMDCLHAQDGGYQTILGCMHRKLSPTETYIWHNGDNVMFPDCSNPKRGEHHEPEGVVVEIHCVELVYRLPPRSRVFRYEVVGDHDLKTLSKCPLTIQLPGGQKKPFSKDCESKNCSFREPEAHVLRLIDDGTITSVKNLDVNSGVGSNEVRFVEEEQTVSIFGPPDLQWQVVIACVDLEKPDGKPLYSNGKAATGSYGPEHRLIATPFTFN